MNTNKQTLIESINKQRRLMGLDEMFDANINAQGALSNNKVDLGMVPLEEMDPEDDDEFDGFDMGGEDDMHDDDRSDDERDFYRGEDPMSLDDRMDMMYPDPNEREFHMNRYGRQDEVMNELGNPPLPAGYTPKAKPPVIKLPSSNSNKSSTPPLPAGYTPKAKPPVMKYSGQNEMMNESELDELFGTGIGAGIKNAFQGIGQNFRTGRLTQQIKTAQAKFDKVIAQANTYLTKNEKIFNDLMSYQKTLASLNANDPSKKSLETVLNNSKKTWDALKNTLSNATSQINQMNQATAGTGTAGATTTGTGTTGTGTAGATTTGAGASGGTQTGGTNMAQSGQTTANLKKGQKVTWTTSTGKNATGTVVGPANKGYTQVKQSTGGMTAVNTNNLKIV